MTETGRWASSETPWKTGQNGQNITKELRRLLVADPGWLLFQFDKEQAESRAVAALAKACSGDDSYEQACEAEDIHTAVAVDCFGVKDRAEAEQPYYQHFTYRDMSKRGGHLSNYYGTPRSMGLALHIPEAKCATFQTNYFGRFRGIPKWHEEVIKTLQAEGALTTATGRRRQFWKRTSDLSTIREAIAYEPQSLVADDINYGILRTYHTLVPTGALKIHLQVHDALVGQVRLEEAASILPKVQECLSNTITVPGKNGWPSVRLTIPTALEVGLNWGPAKGTSNPSGLRAVTLSQIDEAITALVSPPRPSVVVPAMSLSA
jgi:DNA polymerase-1